MTLSEIIQDLHALETRIRAYERKYGITSADFYALYQQGLLDDEGFEQSTEFTRWASAYTMKQKRKVSHPHHPELASTHPHHKHVPPNIKRHRIPAPGLSFTEANLPFLIDEVLQTVLR